jgi:capsular polysaccharide biosynthesis protein
VLVIVILTAAGALIAVGIVEGKGVQYRASIDVRAPTADATCQYFTCPQPVSTTQGNPYVLDQVNAILSPALANQVHQRVPTLTTAQLLNHVCANEIGQSATVRICYQAASKAVAQAVAKTYGTAYVDWSNRQAVTSLTALNNSMLVLWGSLKAPQQSGLRGVTLKGQIDAVQQAIAAFKVNDGPNGAKIFGTDAANQVSTVRSTPSPAKAGLIGAAAGLVLAIGLLLILPPLIRRPGSGDDDRTSGEPRSGEDSLDLFTAPVDEPVR